MMKMIVMIVVITNIISAVNFTQFQVTYFEVKIESSFCMTPLFGDFEHGLCLIGYMQDS
jgi:hypothetical protein